ncbi:hypothetical protein ACXWOC_10135, partial [Streptococcus pyogenes]
MRENVEFRDDDYQGLRVKNLIGGYNYTWTTEPNDTYVKLADRVVSFRKVDFAQARTASNEFKVPALTIPRIRAVMELSDI